VLDDIIELLNDKDIDQNIGDDWKDGLTKVQKFKKWLRNITNENIKDLKKFNFNDIIGERNEPNKFEGKHLVTKTLDFEFDKTDSDWIFELLKQFRKNGDKYDEETKKSIQQGNQIVNNMNIAINDTKDKTDKIRVFDFMNKVSELIDQKLKPLVTKNSDDAIEIDHPTNFKPQLQNNVFSEDDWSAEAKKKNSRKRKQDEADEDYDNVESLSEQEVFFSNKQKMKKPKKNKRISKSKSIKEQIKESYDINSKSNTPQKPSLEKTSSKNAI
jgi:hypothetical protein